MEARIPDADDEQRELERINLMAHPLTTLKLFLLAMVDYLRCAVAYLFSRGGWLLLSSAITAIAAFVLVAFDGPHEKHLEELFKYLRFGIWWIALGVASSIGLGSGLHTFVLYLGPHIAFFTLKAVQCGRVDLKSAPYDTILLKNSPSWLHKNCSEFGEPMFEMADGFHIPIRSVLPQVQIEAVLWGLGTALGELPPYFIARAARTEGVEDHGNGFMAGAARWFLAHAQHLNFFTILLLASVPNPLFDLAGIMCGQFGIPFWEFFSATVIGKAVVKTHIQTIFIISLCNNQLLNWLENELIWMLSFVPGVGPAMPKLIQKLHSVRNKYTLGASLPSNTQAKNWDLSFAYNMVVWIVLLKFFVRIVEATAQQYWRRVRAEEGPRAVDAGRQE